MSPSNVSGRLVACAGGLRAVASAGGERCNGACNGLHFGADLRSCAMANADFGAKLNLVLKAFSLSRGRLAAELKVDKSLVGRWAAGTVTPSAHNLAGLTGLIAKRLPGFSLLDWDLGIAGLAERLGVDANAIAKAAST